MQALKRSTLRLLHHCTKMDEGEIAFALKFSEVQGTRLLADLLNIITKRGIETLEALSPLDATPALNSFFMRSTWSKYIYVPTIDEIREAEMLEGEVPGSEVYASSGAAPKPDPEPAPTPVPPPPPALPEPKPEPKPEPPKPKPKPKAKTNATLSTMEAMIRAGVKNLWLHGPAGCGKTTMASIVAENLGIPCYVLSCSKDTDPAQIQGRRYPEPEDSKFAEFYTKPSVLVLDEFTSVEADTAMLLNAALANGYFETSKKEIARRHENCIIIATSNTLGLGGDALYCGNQRLDASTRDRFACGFIKVDYSAEYESQFDKEVVAYAKEMRKVIALHGLEQICSTRSIIHADLLKKAGLDWKKAMTGTWSSEEAAYLHSA